MIKKTTDILRHVSSTARLFNLAVSICLKEHAGIDIAILFCQLPSGCSSQDQGWEEGGGDQNWGMSMNCTACVYDYYYYY